MADDPERFSMRLDPESRRLLSALGRKLGLKRPGVFRWALWHAAEREGIQPHLPLMDLLQVKPGPRPKPLIEPPAESADE